MSGFQDFPPARRACQARPPVIAADAHVKGLTQEEFVAVSGFSQQLISSLERGGRNPTVATIYELATAFGVRHTELIKPARDAVAPHLYAELVRSADLNSVWHRILRHPTVPTSVPNCAEKMPSPSRASI